MKCYCADFGVSSLRQAEGEDVIAEYESSALWRAPELIEGSSSELGDVYAYGLLIIQIATRCDLPADQVKKNCMYIQKSAYSGYVNLSLDSS